MFQVKCEPNIFILLAVTVAWFLGIPTKTAFHSKVFMHLEEDWNVIIVTEL